VALGLHLFVSGGGTDGRLDTSSDVIRNTLSMLLGLLGLLLGSRVGGARLGLGLLGCA